MVVDKDRYHEKDQFTRISSLMAANRLRFGRRKSNEKSDIEQQNADQLTQEKEILGKFQAW